jgi:hypothetical protein
MAYLAAQEDGAPVAGKSGPTAKAPSKVATPAKTPGAEKSMAPAGSAKPRTSTGKPPVSTSKPAATPMSAQTSASNARPTQSQPTTRPEPMDRTERETHATTETDPYITALQQQVAALVERVSALEKSAESDGAAEAAGSGSGSKSSLFRRRKG